MTPHQFESQGPQQGKYLDQYAVALQNSVSDQRSEQAPTAGVGLVYI